MADVHKTIKCKRFLLNYTYNEKNEQVTETKILKTIVKLVVLKENISYSENARIYVTY